MSDTLRTYRRQLLDLAKILTNLPNERWDDKKERAALLSALTTWPPTLIEIAAYLHTIDSTFQ